MKSNLTYKTISTVIERGVVASLLTLFILITFSSNLLAQGNNFIILSGTIIDQETNQPISGASVIVKIQFRELQQITKGNLN